MSRESQTARIYRQPKSAMQSGRARTADWVLAFAPLGPKRIDPLMGWSGSGDTNAQVNLRFPSQEAAIAYAQARGIPYDVEATPLVKADIKPKAYADNFRFGRTENWSH
ncbi:MAG: ETC complex I subunit [Roseomonas sp.]|jgi:hypothetical protein|nr:ETC complex I subunit [Roseomonas sp.]